MKNSNKKVLKTIVKECLLEILAEGLIGNNQVSRKEVRELRGTLQETHERNQNNFTTNSITQNHETAESRTSQRPSYLNKMKMGVAQAKNTISESTRSRVASITTDPIMSEILADTAATTLQEQRESNSRRMQPSLANADNAARVVDAHAPEDLFGDSASKWANLAFAPSIRK